MFRRLTMAAAMAVYALLSHAARSDEVTQHTDASLARGRYVLQVGGCNDCHTPGYNEAAGKAPNDQWLVGQAVGFQGPWGTSYPANLRLTVQTLTEDQWLTIARAPRLPPMPWFNLRDMNDGDLRAMHRYIKSLGPAGERAPAAVPPGGDVTTPYIVFVPQMPARVSQAARPGAATGGH